MDMVYDIAFLGHYTKDTIVSAEGTRVVDGGAFNYGSHAAVRMGLKVAAITRLAKEDLQVAEQAEGAGGRGIRQSDPPLDLPPPRLSDIQRG